MEFLNPAALYTSFLLPLLLIPYLIRGKPRRLVFSSLLLLKEFSSSSAGRPWGRLRLPLAFFLQLFFLLLLILALGEPVFSARPLNLAIVIDNSASMQAGEGQKSRFEIVQAEARDLLREVPSNARVNLFVIVPDLERIGEEALGPEQASTLITTFRPYDLGEPPKSYGEELLRLAEERKYERIYFLTDHPVQGRDETIKVVTVGRPKDNLAVTSFYIAGPSFVSSQLKATIEVTSFSSEEENVNVLLKGGGKLLSRRAQIIPPRKTIVVSFEGFPSLPHYEAELKVNDGLALDNRRFAVPSAARGLDILGISPRPEALQSLSSIPGLRVKVISPKAYERSRDEGHALEIFHYSAPASLPRSHALFVLPPDENPLVGLEKPLSRPIISDWSDPHPLTRYVNFALFHPTYARPLKPSSFGEAVIKSAEGALAVTLEHEGFRYLVLGFDPFPYLGQRNLPVSIFTLNFLQWFYEGTGRVTTATGEPLRLPTMHRAEFLLTPKEEKIPLNESQTFFSKTLFQGLYQVGQGKETRFMAVNLQDTKESDLNRPQPISLRREGSGILSSPSFFHSFWPYLLLISLLLLFIEWFLNPPVSQPDFAGRRG